MAYLVSPDICLEELRKLKEKILQNTRAVELYLSIFLTLSM
jgi:hypothetical protein